MLQKYICYRRVKNKKIKTTKISRKTKKIRCVICFVSMWLYKPKMYMTEII